MTLLSIVVANYNNAHYLPECIASIFQSDTVDIEVIVIDDCSTDNSMDVLEQLSKSYPIRNHRRSQNGGVEAANHTGIELSQGDYLHLFASDDLYLPGAIPTIVEAIKQNPFLPIFSSDFASFSVPSSIKVDSLLRIPSFRAFSPKQVFSLFRNTKFWIPGHTAFVKKSAYLPYLPQDKQLGPISDWYLYHQMALQGGLGYFPQALIARREDPNSYSSRYSLSERRQMWLHLLSRLDPDSALARSGICRMLGLKAIYKDLLKKPRYWKFLIYMLKRAINSFVFFFKDT